jgi:hypothetical protein
MPTRDETAVAIFDETSESSVVSSVRQPGAIDPNVRLIGRANQVRSNEDPIVDGLNLADDDEVGI